MLKFFIANYVQIINLFISLAALTISFTNAWRDRKRIDPEIEVSGIVDRVETFDKVPAYPNQTAGVLVIFRFLNPSPRDIGFFDITFRDLTTGQLLSAYYKLAIRPEMADQKMLSITETPDGPLLAHFNPMDSNYGVVPSNTLKRFETVVHPISQYFSVDVKFAIKTIRKNKHAVTRKHYKHKFAVIHVSDHDWQRILQSQQEVQSSLQRSR